MIEIPTQSYERVLPLVQASGMRGHLTVVYEVLECRKSGHIYVDDAANPQTALVCNPCGFYVAFGRPDEELLRPLVDFFWQQNETMWEIKAGLYGSSMLWDAVLRRLLSQRGAIVANRLGFEYHPQAIQPAETRPPSLPDGFRIEPITAQLAQSILDGTGTAGYGIDPWFIQIAGGPEAYAALGLGLALTHRPGQIASLCGCCALSHGEAEMEVGTIPSFRGQGLAPIVCAAFIEQCRSRGLQPAYTCDSSNRPSIAVAHKLGFHEVEEIPGYTLFAMPEKDSPAQSGI